MTRVQDMVQSNPSGALVDEATLAECIDACYECAQTCSACADACLGEQDANPLVKCIRDDLDCAGICVATGNVLSRQTQPSQEIVAACAAACKQCGDTCEEHADHHEHCRVCMEACRRCESACNDVLSAMAA